jgi:hypothetical protein
LSLRITYNLFLNAYPKSDCDVRDKRSKNA